VWDFIQDEIFGMKWLNRLIGSLLNACGLDTESKLGGSLQFFMTVNSFTGIDDIDLCRLLSNMLDNAITATSEIKSTDKRISVNISEDIGTYTFLVRNTIEESVLTNNPQLLSTKKNKEISGLGTSIIRDIADKYNGRCDFYEKGNEFCCSVILNTEV
jgi:sensor histidine kinase regulating citrate/malate metabolism